ncbi:MAG: HNH endonuclease signature motif containing protein [Cyanobacteria bacterium P01_G01_bin.39]
MNLSSLFDAHHISLIWKESSHEKLIEHPQYGMISPNELRAKFDNTPCPYCDKIMKHGESYKTNSREEAIARKFYYLDSSGHKHFCKIGNVYFSDRYVTLDHILNKARFPNKMFDAENLAAVCWKCNHIKSDNNLFGILRKRANARRRRKKLFKGKYL